MEQPACTVCLLASIGNWLAVTGLEQVVANRVRTETSKFPTAVALLFRSTFCDLGTCLCRQDNKENGQLIQYKITLEIWTFKVVLGSYQVYHKTFCHGNNFEWTNKMGENIINVKGTCYDTCTKTSQYNENRSHLATMTSDYSRNLPITDAKLISLITLLCFCNRDYLFL